MRTSVRLRGLVAWLAVAGAAATGAACATSGNSDGAEGGAPDATADGTDDAADDAARDVGVLPGSDAAADAGMGSDGGGFDATPEPEAGTDAGHDARAPHDAGGDGERDGGHDAATHEGGAEAGRDGATEAGHDAGHEAGHDGSVEGGHDAGHDAGHEAGGDASDGGLPPPPAQGEILVTEVMFDPTTTEPNTEWFEVHSTVASARLLSGLVLKDGAGRTHTIAASPPVVLDAGVYMLLVRLAADAEAAKVPAAAILYEYGTGLASTQGILLANGSTGGIQVLDASGTTVLAESPYGPWSLGGSGKGVQLKNLTFADESVKASWCASSNPWASGSDDGTPGAPDDCP